MFFARAFASTARRAPALAGMGARRAALAGFGAAACAGAACAALAPLPQCAGVRDEIASLSSKLQSIEAKLADKAAASEAASPSAFGAFSIAGKTAVVTGAASGIGFAIAELFASKGALVHVLDINKEAAQSAAAKIAAKTGNNNVTGWSCNVTDEHAVNDVFDCIASGPGARIDILINNAGIAAVGNVMTTKVQDMDKLYAVNIKGVFFCLQAGVRHMLADGKGGAIVNLASIASLFGLKDRFAYGMSKGAVLTMTYSVATDYMRQGIRCNAVAPARVHTPFVDGFIAKNYPGKEKEVFQKLAEYQPIGRMGEPREVAALILYLCSEESAFVTGNCYPIDGGVTYCVDGRP